MRLRSLAVMAMMAALCGMIILAFQMASLTSPPPREPTIPSRLRPSGARKLPPQGGAGGAAFPPAIVASAPFSAANLEQPVYDSMHRATVPPAMAGASLRDHVADIVSSNADLLSHSPAQPSTVTFVTGLWDLGRGTMDTSSQWSVLRRPFNHYLQGLKQFLAYPFPKVLYCDASSCAQAAPLIEQAASAGGGPTKMVVKSLDDVAREFAFFDLVDEVRNRKEWSSQSQWLANSPQAKLKFFNPVVMSKVAFTRDAARWNPFHTDGFLWLDASHLCHNPAKLRLNKQDFIVRYLDKFLATFHSFEPSGPTTLGFATHAFNSYLNRNRDDTSALPLARGGVLGGTREYLEVAAAVFDAVLGATLHDGFMGTDQNVLTIMDYLSPELFHHFEPADSSQATCAVFDEFLNPPMDPLVDGWETRGLNCKHIPEERTVRCFDGLVRCPDHVTPAFLEEAKGQGTCNEPAQYFCRVTCTRDGAVGWAGEVCPNDGVQPCPPWPRTKLPGYHPAAEAPPATAVHGPPQEPVPQVAPDTPHTDEFTGEALLARAQPEHAEAVRGQGGFDLRGLGCEIKDGKERCFYEDTEGRELCPEHITSALLTAGDGQYLCLPSTAGYYCTASCSEGTDIMWHAHEAKWCNQNKDNCPPRPEIVPVEDYHLKPWSQVIRPPMQCTRPAGGLPKITAVILAYKETESLSASLQTYKEAQFLEHIDETILYLNARNAEMEAVAAPYTLPPYNVKLMGDSNNYGIAQALNWMFGNATNEYVLFLEKDFRLVESLDCALEQLATGLTMLQEGTAQVVRYRSRHNPGRPNWARILYKGHEDDVFKNQPNLLCNFHHWVDSPDKRWPNQFYPCWKGSDGEVDRSKVFYCTKAEFCNWTNNPVLISKTWWHNEYEVNFDNFKNINPYDDLELYMNWEPGSWNDRPYVVAQGEGMFRHMDKKKWGM